ncbi:MAG: FAD-dependent monooxygenase [Gammaproteobacteria bacterium]|uniref:FAD-dependent monooxygenase n=1 Tax=Pseudacidovorax sp. TaxID=1934311 RepID=UPI001B47EB5E|nr:FAD-dependent monooxygenase [Pseudacidovorax sp.]MBP6893781.1 FAD-dependent monooxygenase [Pseudacidovorax sp.]
MRIHSLIVGGGIGGLAAALALARAGHTADLMEQAPAFSEVGAGIQLGPNVVRRLRALGLGEALNAIVAHPERLCVSSALNGGRIATMPLAGAMEQRYGAPYFTVHRADLHGLLLEAVRAQASGAVTLSTGARIERLSTRGDEFVCAATDDGRAWEGDALIGADGVWGRVRPRIWPDAAPARPTGHMAFRALLEQNALPAALRSRQVDVWLAPRLHAVAYPVRGGERLNLVVLTETSPDEVGADARDWDQAASRAALDRATGHVGQPLRALLDAVPAWRAWTLCDRTPLTGPQEMVDGRVALLGDAAHPMLPYLAQGAGMAIEDAVTLAQQLSGCTSAEVPQALARYAQARWARNAQVQARARRNGRIFHLGGPVRWGRDLAMRLAGPALMDQPWLYAG